MTQRSAEAEDNEDTDTNQEQGKAEMTTSNQAVIARLDELAKELSELHRLVDMLPDQDAHSDCASVLSEENTRDIDADVLAFMRDLCNDSVHGKAVTDIFHLLRLNNDVRIWSCRSNIALAETISSLRYHGIFDLYYNPSSHGRVLA